VFDSHPKARQVRLALKFHQRSEETPKKISKSFQMQSIWLGQTLKRGSWKEKY